MTSPNFASILSEAPTEIDRPKPLPIGTYLCVVGPHEVGQSSKKKTDFLKFPLKPLAPMADVNEADLEEMGGLEGRNLSITFYITPDAVFMLDDFHSNCGCDIATDGLNRADRNEEVVNSQVLAVVEHEPSQDPNDERVFVRVRRTARAD
jgi:hypothetical protein